MQCSHANLPRLRLAGVSDTATQQGRPPQEPPTPVTHQAVASCPSHKLAGPEVQGPEQEQQVKRTQAATSPRQEQSLSSLLQNVLGSRGPKHFLEEDYSVGPVIGKGGYAVVRLLEDWRTGELVACKTISKARLLCKEDVEDVVREIEILHLLAGHPNITGLKATFEDKRAVHMVMDYCEGGELFDRIVNRGTFSEAEAARYFRQMVEVVCHCHSCGVVHRDIKLENFLLTSFKEDAKLEACDFGLSVYFKPGQRFTELIGSPYYVAPEVLARDYSQQCDLWSLGVVLYMLLSGMPPFWGPTNKEIFQRILEGHADFETHPWPWISAEAKDIVQRLLTLDPGARPTAEELLCHPWLAKHGVAPDKPLDSLVITRMRRFAAMNKLKKAAVVAASKHLTPKQMEGLRQLFSSFDTNGDGVISLGELRDGLQRMHSQLSETELEQVMRELDVDGSGSIDYEEFLAATVNLRLLEQDDLLMLAFQELDTDGSGFLSPDEIAAAVDSTGSMTSADIQELIAQHDSNNDGVIDWAEFLAMLRGDVELQRARTLHCKSLL